MNADYKNKYRTLLFNLKDAHNPELRARVLMGDIPPAKLVRMTSEQLASKVRAVSDLISGAVKSAPRGHSCHSTGRRMLTVRALLPR